jgi:hypothetical protein
VKLASPSELAGGLWLAQPSFKGCVHAGCRTLAFFARVRVLTFVSLSGRRERTDRNVISIRISERELLGLRVRIHVRLLFEPRDERARPLKRQVEIIDTEEQQEPVAGCPVIGAHQ